MSSEVRQYVIDSLKAMNYEVQDVTGTTSLGPEGLDLESLAIAELAVRVEERYGVKFTEDEAEQMVTMNLDQFVAEVTRRAGLPAS